MAKALPALGGLAMLTACMAPTPEITPKARPAGLVPTAPAEKPYQPSERSRSLARYYQQVQADLLAQGLMRTDGGGPDTRYSASDLSRNFERIAFFDEHARGNLGAPDGRAGQLHRWIGPVRMKIHFGPSIGAESRAKDSTAVTAYAQRLARVTKHPIGVTKSLSGNFHVLFMSEDDTGHMLGLVQRIAPDISTSTLAIFRDVPRSIHCLVLAFPSQGNDNRYSLAIALIRAEHPDLLRRSCIHEELAQGLGLANDSPRARPSIFNDDDEFAYLTTHDEMLLKMLYDRRLKPGMSIEQSRPIYQKIAAELTGNNS